MENEEEIKKNSENIKDKKKSEEAFNKKLKKNQFKIMTTFKKIKNLYSDGIVPLIKHHKRAVGDFLQDLMGDERDYKKSNLKNRKKNEIQTSKSLNNKSHMSDNAKYLSNKIKMQIDKVRKKQDDITALNALYLNNNKSFTDIEQLSNSNNRYINNNKNNSTNLDRTEKKENYEEALRKKKLRNNFELITNNYHQKLNDAFSKFNPKMNLNNLKMLIQLSPTMRDDISKIKEEVDGDIKDITDKNRYHKQYERILKKNQQSKSTKLLDPKLYKSDEIVQKSLSTKNHTSSINNKRKSTLILPKIKKPVSLLKNRDESIKMEILKRMKNKDTKKAMSIMDEQNEQIHRLHNISQQINSYIESENISQKIDSHLNDYKMYKYLEFLKKRQQAKNSAFKPRDYFVYQNKKINDLYNDLYINKLESRILDKQRKYHESLLSNRAGYFNKMNDDLKNSLKEFDNNISSSGINLDENQENNLDTL